MGVLYVLGFALAAFVTAAPLDQGTVVPLLNSKNALVSVNTTILQAHSNVAGVLPLINANIQSNAISEELFSNLKLYAQYCEAAYCTPNTDGENGVLTCHEDACPLLKVASISTILKFSSDVRSDQRGFIAIDHKAKQIVLAFRGSTSIRNYIYDGMLWRKKISNICDGCSAHRGFRSAWLHNRAAVLSVIDLTVADHPDYKLIVAGYSLGGGVAFIAGAELRSRGHHVDIYTYGSPRTGNRAFVDFLTTSADITARVTHAGDIIPKVPWMFMGYHHTSPEYWLSSGKDQSAQSEKTNYGIEDVHVCVGVDNLDCNGSTGWTVDIKAHQHYFDYLFVGAPIPTW